MLTLYVNMVNNCFCICVLEILADVLICDGLSQVSRQFNNVGVEFRVFCQTVAFVKFISLLSMTK